MRIAPGRNDKSLAEGFRLARRRGASIDRGFVWGLTGVPTDRRLAAQVLHALWCELVEVAGRPDIVETRMASLAGWREEIARAFAQEPTVPLGAALAAIIETYELPYEEFMLLVDGIEMDAAEMMVAPERAHFDYYVRATAGALGVLLVAILGAHEPAARKIPMVLGEALAFTTCCAIWPSTPDAAASTCRATSYWSTASGSSSRPWSCAMAACPASARAWPAWPRRALPAAAA